MIKLNVDGYNDVDWRGYKEYSRVLQTIVPEERDDLTTDDMTEIMFCAALLSGWVIGMDKPETENPKEFLAELQGAFEKEHPGNVLEILNDFLEFYVPLRQPDPN